MKFKREWWPNSEPVSLAAAIEDVLVQDDIDGVAERASATSREVAKALSQIVEMLHDNGHLSDDQVRSLVRYRYEAVE